MRPAKSLVCWALATIAVGLGVAPSLRAGEPEAAYRGLRWRLLGPFRGGWATCVAGVPGDPALFYFGSADGGVWRTTDAGVTWTPLFEREGSASIGALAVAPSDPKTLWVGTGQVHQRWDIASGDGVYRSRDGGESWQRAGLQDTRHIGRFWVDPRNADVALVAALGHVFGPNDERGVFRTEDGGQSWRKVLYRDADTGAVDLAADPAIPDTLFASLWQVRRHPWLDYFQPTVGAGSGIYVSRDAGRTWSAAGTAGLPVEALGRISLAVAPGTKARRVWAAIQAEKKGGLYRSDDGGVSWTLINGDSSLGSSYMSGLTPDPADPETLWSVGRSLRRSQDGGKRFILIKGAPGGDDYHFLWIDPREPRRMITGADQGAVVTLNGGRSWSSWYNQPTGQFYRLASDDRVPYRVYSGQQDSGTVAIASRSDYGQLTFRDWSPVGGDERDGDVPDPTNPDVVYGAGLGGRLSKWDARTGQVQNVAPWPISSYGERPGTSRYRYSWITPFAIAPRPPHALYLGAQVLFRSRDGGRSWQTISPDLTGARPDAKGCSGDVRVEDATACGYGVIFAITPSPAADGLIWLGTDNGRVHLTRDDGAAWTDVTPPGLRDWSKVNSIDASASDPATAYVAADRHRLDDLRPYAYRTHDYGKTWTEIGRGLPETAWVGVVRADPQRPGLLYAGTSSGVHVSFDDGASWQALQLNLPTSGVNDLIVKDDDLIAATQGRALWALDGLAPLRHHLANAARVEGAQLVPPATAYRRPGNRNKDTPLPPEEPRGENPPAGALIDYVLSETPGPVTIEIFGPDGTLVRRFRSDEPQQPLPGDYYFAELWRGPEPRPATNAGHNRFVWDLRHPRPRAREYEVSIAAVPGRPASMLPLGPFVLPGNYEVRLDVGGRSLRQALTVAPDPRSAATPEELRALLDFQREVIATLEQATDLAQPSAALVSLESDLEAADAAPTAAQREVLEDVRRRIAAAREPR